MKKILSMFVVVIMLLVTLNGCSLGNSSKAYTWDVNTGDKIKIKLDTADGYDITSNVPFIISKDDETLSQGTFITMDDYNQYMNSIETDTNVSVIDSGSKNGVTYTFYSFSNSEFNYLIKVNDSITGILLGNPNSQSEAEEIFDRLIFSKE